MSEDSTEPTRQEKLEAKKQEKLEVLQNIEVNLNEYLKAKEQVVGQVLLLDEQIAEEAAGEKEVETGP